MSANTIMPTGKKIILPFTRLGDIYYYPLDKVNEILLNNSSNIY